MISAFARASQVLRDAECLERAAAAARFLLDRAGHGPLFRTAKDGRTAGLGYLDDHAALIAALIDLYEASFEREWIEAAVRLDDVVQSEFWDSEPGGYFYTGKTTRGVAGPVTAAVRQRHAVGERSGGRKPRPTRRAHRRLDPAGPRRADSAAVRHRDATVPRRDGRDALLRSICTRPHAAGGDRRSRRRGRRPGRRRARDLPPAQGAGRLAHGGGSAGSRSPGGSGARPGTGRGLRLPRLHVPPARDRSWRAARTHCSRPRAGIDLRSRQGPFPEPPGGLRSGPDSR